MHIKAVKHSAISTLAVLSRSRQAKELIGFDGIPSLIDMVKDETSTSQSKYYALLILWSAVYEDRHKEIMFECGIIDVVVKYLNDPKKYSVEKGNKVIFFLMSHLSYLYPVQVVCLPCAIFFSSCTLFSVSSCALPPEPAPLL